MFTSGCSIRTALRMRVSMSAIGSVIMLSWTPGNGPCRPQAYSDKLPELFYQLAIRTPGIFPWSANLRKQIRHKPNLRYTARGRPHRLQRDSARVLNFGGRLALAIFDLLATGFSFPK